MEKSTKNLLDAFIHGNLSKEEWDQLLQDIRDNRETFSALDEWWPHAGADVPDSRKEMLFNQLMHTLQEPVTSRRKRPLRNRRIRQAMLLGLPLVLLVVLIFSYHRKQSDLPHIALQANDMLPGKANVVLTLSDGREVKLSENQHLQLTDGNNSIIASPDGTLRYAPNSTGYAPNTPALHTLQTKAGNKYRIILADGTIVWLNNASSLRYPVQFTSKTREVLLTGEAYFEIATDARHPFIVKTGHQNVEVLGTHFNINAYHSEDSIVTTLLEGKIRVYDSRKPTEALVVHPSQQTVFQDQRISVTAVPADTSLAVGWKNGLFSFDNTPVKDALEEIARWYKADIRFEGSIPDKRISGQIHRNIRLSQLRELLRYDGIDFYIEDQTIVVPAQ
ncbi:FecR domain-containing protein [Chitinophaga sancti]|uniref:FecR family protein n=1 Tax=Chitinophaga sancti TaxID=1004 RepID=UPI002A74DFBC|nr:FecR domain-containing protein [Chitinophaga sancti]WPQ62421.1 FecR domain-containing protein [Chitinophaga sancti]